MPKILVLGGNFAGLTAALELKHALHDEADVTIVSKSDSFLFVPSLIWVPFGWRTPEEITFELAPVLEENKIGWVHAEATRIDPITQTVTTPKGVYPYDYLVITTGVQSIYDGVPGLGPDANSLSITSLPHALQAAAAWKSFINDPGPAVIGATQGASCFGAAYEFLFNFAHAIHKEGLTKQVPITFVTAEPFAGHFGIGGLKGGEWMLGMFFKQLGITFVGNSAIEEVLPGEIRLEGGTTLPSRYSMIIPPFQGVNLIKDSPGIGDARGFIPVCPNYQHEKFENIYAAGSAVAVNAPWQTPISVGVPKTGFPAEVMAKIAAHNIIARIHGKPPTEAKEFGDIPAVCVMDAGNMGVMIFSDKMLPPRKHEVLIPGPQAHWAKLAFEKYFLWKMKHGYAGLP